MQIFRNAWVIPTALATMSAVGLVVGAAEADANGFFGEITAAWVQAVGSIGAIVVSAALAIWVDQGAARRQRSILEAAEQKRKAEIVEVTLAFAEEAFYVYGYTQRMHEWHHLSSKDPDDRWHRYRRWEVVIERQRRTMEKLAEHMTAPELMAHAYRVVTAVEVPERPAASEGMGQVISSFSHELRFLLEGMVGPAYERAKAADLAGHFREHWRLPGHADLVNGAGWDEPIDDDDIPT